ncbi:MAG TPA: hypothetical protein VMG82_30480 [Candidatus Sulfotelmatobacter sp.]|nr:hypothetical protein [Candidatus Sulfotelmatobacter sp.]
MTIDQVAGLFTAVTLIEMMVTSGLVINTRILAQSELARNTAFNEKPHKP